MFLNLTTLRSELGQKIKNATVSNTRRDRWLNLAQDDILTEVDPDHLIFTTTVSTVANTRKYYLNMEFNKILSGINVTQNVVMNEISENEMEDLDPNQSNTGTAYVFSVYGYEHVQGQPASAATVSIVSSSAADTTQKVRITGTVSSVEDTELLTLNGTTTVTGTKLFSEIYSLSKDGTTTGRVTVTSNDAGVTTLAIFAPNLLSLERQPIYMFPIPSGVESIRFRGIRRPRRIVNAEDSPDFPESYHELVLIGAAIRGHRDLFRPSLAKDVYENEWVPFVDKLKKQMGNKRGRTSPVIRGGISVRPPIGIIPDQNLNQ